MSASKASPSATELCSSDSSEVAPSRPPKRPHDAQLPSITSKDDFLHVDAKKTSPLGALSESGPHYPLSSPTVALIDSIPGLLYLPDFVSVEEEKSLMSSIDTGSWDTTLKRRVQHFGLRYDYTVKSVDKTAEIQPLPTFMVPIVARIEELKLFSETPNQCIVNGTFRLSNGQTGHCLVRNFLILTF